uniref:Uncharacterized protein n=1 Tax=Chenopodium quinoa TaxID=63459 RepID=A0A803L2I6_CHEQI
MMRRHNFLVPFIALLLGALAMTFSLIAFTKRVKAKDVTKKDRLCVYPSSPSSALGIVAALFLLAEQIVISAATYCFCCCGLRCSARCTVISSLLFFIGSWFTFLITFIGLIYTAILNNNNFLAKAYTRENIDSCEVWYHMLSGRVVLLKQTVITKAAVDHEHGVAMGEPQTQQPKE